MRRIFVDMDGVTAKFEPASIEEMTTPGFFISRKPVESVISMVKLLQKEKDVEVFVLSSYLLPISKEEKIRWNEQYTSIPRENQIYVPYGQDKAEFLRQLIGMQEDDVLVDDFTPNLKTWNGVGVKLYNGINGTHGTWDGYSIHSNMAPEVMYTQLNAISVACHDLLLKRKEENYIDMTTYHK